MKFCPYCGAGLKHGAIECATCNKEIAGKSGAVDEKNGFTSRDAYERTVIPWWIVAIVVGIFLLGFALMFFQ